MKKRKLEFLILLTIGVITINGYARGKAAAEKTERLVQPAQSSHNPNSLLSLDEALAAAVYEIENKLARGTRIAIIKIETPLTRFSNYLQDELSEIMLNNQKLQVLTRNEQLELVKNELNFQMSGYVDDNSFAGLGHMLGAQSVANGSFEDLGGFYQLRIRVIKVQTDENMQFAEVQVNGRFRVKKDDMVVSGFFGTTGQAAMRVAETAIQYYNRGGEYLLTGKYDLAIEEYGKALAASPNFAAAYYDRAIAYNGKGNYDTAIADYTKAININQFDTHAYSNRGAVYYRKGYYDMAIADFTKAIAIDSYLGVAYYNRGLAYQDKRDYDRAIADYTSAVRISPDTSAYNNRGISYFAQGNYDRAIADFTRIISINPNDVSAYYNRGIAYKTKGDNVSAINDFNAALKLNPNHAGTLRALEEARRKGN